MLFNRQEMIVIAPQPQQRPLARARPAARETLPASVAHTKNCKLTSCRKVSASHARKASNPARSETLAFSPQHLFAQAAVISPVVALTYGRCAVLIGCGAPFSPWARARLILNRSFVLCRTRTLGRMPVRAFLHGARI
jgi:hypothetical protein